MSDGTLRKRRILALLVVTSVISVAPNLVMELLFLAGLMGLEFV